MTTFQQFYKECLKNATMSMILYLVKTPITTDIDSSFTLND